MAISSLTQSPYSQLPARLSSQASSSSTAEQPGNRLSTAVAADVAEKSSSQHQDALKIFERTLTMGYDKLKGAQQNSAAAQFSSFEPLTAEKVADNILGFIERRLQLDMADGATQEELQARLDAGLSGFKKGFAEASEKLKALSMLSPAVEQDIGKTYDRVLAGVDDLAKKFLGKGEPKVVTKPSADNAAETAKKAYGTLVNSTYQYAAANSFSFQLTTAEGDNVTISASASRAYAAEYNDGSGVASSASSYSASIGMNWAVDGDLNDDELNAINDLLGKVNNLAAEFFGGNLDEAFNQALSLGYDDEQITRFSLNLTQVEVQRVSNTYKQFDGAPNDSLARDLSEKLLPLGDFVKDLLDALDSASTFADPQTLLADVSENMAGENTEAAATDGQNDEQPGARLRSFVEQIFASLNRQ